MFSRKSVAILTLLILATPIFAQWRPKFSIPPNRADSVIVTKYMRAKGVSVDSLDIVVRKAILGTHVDSMVVIDANGELHFWSLDDAKFHLTGPETQALSIGTYTRIANSGNPAAGQFSYWNNDYVVFHPTNTASQNHAASYWSKGLRVKIGSYIGQIISNVQVFSGDYYATFEDITGDLPSSLVAINATAEITFLGDVVHWDDPDFIPFTSFDHARLESGTFGTKITRTFVTSEGDPEGEAATSTNNTETFGSTDFLILDKDDDVKLIDSIIAGDYLYITVGTKKIIAKVTGVQDESDDSDVREIWYETPALYTIGLDQYRQIGTGSGTIQFSRTVASTFGGPDTTRANLELFVDGSITQSKYISGGELRKTYMPAGGLGADFSTASAACKTWLEAADSIRVHHVGMLYDTTNSYWETCTLLFGGELRDTTSTNFAAAATYTTYGDDWIQEGGNDAPTFAIADPCSVISGQQYAYWDATDDKWKTNWGTRDIVGRRVTGTSPSSYTSSTDGSECDGAEIVTFDFNSITHLNSQWYHTFNAALGMLVGQTETAVDPKKYASIKCVELSRNNDGTGRVSFTTGEPISNANANKGSQTLTVQTAIVTLCD